jgi:DNA-binding NarL/FixJ family response regulator
MSLRSVVLADDHAFLLAGMEQALDNVPGLSVVAKASDGIEAIAQIKTLKPDCAVLDHTMPGATGLEVLIEGRRWSPETRFVVVTGSGLPTILREIVEVGVEGLMLKSAPPEEICRVVRDVAYGGMCISEDVRALLDQAGQAEALTDREREVLHSIARGLSNAKTSDVLGISPKTVDSHRTSLMRKLGVNSTAALLVRAMRDGLIDVSDTT